MVGAAACTGQIRARAERLQGSRDSAAVQIIGGDRHVDVARGAREATQLQRDSADEYEADVVADEHAQQRAVALVRLGHANSRRSSRGLRVE